jgi:hypothetical protein
MSNSLDAVLSQYEKNKADASRPKTQRMSEEERKKKYFNSNLAQNESTGEKRIRILPTRDGSSPFVEVYYHEIQVGGKWMKLYDPGMNEGKPSPLNETYSALMAAGDAKSKELAKQYKAKKFYIVKVIDRDAEADGPKFWRFKSNYKNEGVLDKIIPIYKKKGEIHNAETGRDLILTLSKATTNGAFYYTNISGVLYEDPTALSEDPALAQAWVDDATTWEDVYSKKPLDYLQGVAAGYEPKWSTQLKKFTWGDNTEEGAELSSTGSASQFLTEDTTDSFVDDDSLPF